MRPVPRQAILCTALAAALAAPAESLAVRLAPDGLGQALIFPYYTVQSAGANPFNTYISVVNTSSAAKAVRVRFREGRMGAETLSFNLFLSPNDMWTAALVPSADGTRLLTTDNSCTDGLQAGATAGQAFADFRNTAFSGSSDDGAGSGLDRTREGYVEMIEMATLTGTSANAVARTPAGAPANCAAVQGFAPVPTAAPGGGLTGGLTLINVANGMEFSMNAVALADLATRPFYRQATDPYPDFNATEIDPVSAVVANGALYRSTWNRSVDAVSSVLMATAIAGEYVLDDTTASNTDFVLTFPTRRYYSQAPGTLAAPFGDRAGWAADCYRAAALGTLVQGSWADREAATASVVDFGGPPPSPNHRVCGAAVVFDVTNGSAHTTPEPATRVLGSLARGFALVSDAGAETTSLEVPRRFAHGWLRFVMGFAGLASLPSSTRVDLATGATTTGSQTYFGLPVVGFGARTFVNGTLTCGAGACQGNYGAAFPLRLERTITGN